MKSMIDLMDWDRYVLLVPVVVQEEEGAIVGRAWTTRELLVSSLETGTATLCDEVDRKSPIAFFVRSVLCEETYDVSGIFVNCDCNSLLYRVNAPNASRIFRRHVREPDFSRGLVAAIAVGPANEVLMFAWMNEEAFNRTKETRFAHYFSCSRKRLWKKGEQSGHVQHVNEHAVSSDRKTVLLFVDRQEGGAACHDGYRSCFYRRMQSDGSVSVIGERIFDPKQVYKK